MDETLTHIKRSLHHNKILQLVLVALVVFIAIATVYISRQISNPQRAFNLMPRAYETILNNGDNDESSPVNLSTGPETHTNPKLADDAICGDNGGNITGQCEPCSTCTLIGIPPFATMKCQRDPAKCTPTGLIAGHCSACYPGRHDCAAPDNCLQEGSTWVCKQIGAGQSCGLENQPPSCVPDAKDDGVCLPRAYTVDGCKADGGKCVNPGSSAGQKCLQEGNRIGLCADGRGAAYALCCRGVSEDDDKKDPQKTCEELGGQCYRGNCGKIDPECTYCEQGICLKNGQNVCCGTEKPVTCWGGEDRGKNIGYCDSPNNNIKCCQK